MLRLHRLPSFGEIHTRLNEAGARLGVVGLWKQFLVGSPPVEKSTFGLEMAFFERVNTELFPLDMDTVGLLLECTDDPQSIIDCPICIEGYGIPWQEEYLGGIAAPFQPVLAMVADGLELWSGMEDFFNAVDMWFDVAGREDFKRPVLEYGALDDLQIELYQLDPPLNGLGDVLAAIVQETGNPFLDYLGYPYEDGFAGQFLWCKADVSYLTLMWKQARSSVQRIKEYSQWYHTTRGSAEIVVDAIARSIEKLGSEEDL
jgi:hypothetical protein